MQDNEALIPNITKYMNVNTPCDLSHTELQAELLKEDMPCEWSCAWDNAKCTTLKQVRIHVFLKCDRTYFRCPLCSYPHIRGSMISHWRDVCPEITLLTCRGIFDWLL